jgi:hypothetical protein
MPPYTGPNKENPFYRSKFVRTGETIVVTNPNDIFTRHDALASQEGLTETVHESREANPDEVDAGILAVSADQNKILVTGDSSMLSLPVSKNARARSIEVFKAQSEGWNVTESTMGGYTIYRR